MLVDQSALSDTVNITINNQQRIKMPARSPNRDINYLSKDFESIKTDLMEFSKSREKALDRDIFLKVKIFFGENQ